MTWIDAGVAQEFPELCLRTSRRYAARSGPQPAGAGGRLHVLWTASAVPQAVALRQQPVPWAYRVFFRHIGLDPDDPAHAGRGPHSSTASSTAASARAPLLDDALTIAIAGDGRRRVGARRRPGRGRARAAPRGARRAASAKGEYASDIPAGRLPGGRRRRARSASCSAPPSPGTRREPRDDAHPPCSRSRSPASPTSTSRRRCGRSPTSSASLSHLAQRVERRVHRGRLPARPSPPPGRGAPGRRGAARPRSGR